jgi:hypothetical protein
MDEAEAVRLYRLAADQGHADAQFRLGLMFEDGRGVAKNESKLWVLFGITICLDDGRRFAENEAEAVRLYRLAVAQGHAGAQNNLGCMFANGRGVVKNKAEAVRLYRLAADQGDADAQYNLGKILKKMYSTSFKGVD